MEIRELNLAAFGPFTERKLVFDQDPGGFHIIYGPNEAGKSSALRGLKALLYQIDERTTDNFLHANDKLRIVGCLRAVDGRELTFARRKGRKNTLLSMENEPLDESVLTSFLQGVTLPLFEMLFGIDHRALVQGGQEILAQKGEVGQALFSASLGSHALHAVLGQLDDEADALFRPRGSTQTINAALKTFTDLNKEIRERSLSSREWDEHRRALSRTSQELAQTQSELANNRAEVNRLQRIQRVLPKLARRCALLQNIDALGEVIILPNDFGQRRQEALRERDTAQTILQKATARLNGFQQQLERRSVRQEVLEQSESIENLHVRLGGYRKALQDRPQLEAECQQRLIDAEALLKELRPGMALDDVDQLRPIYASKQRITELGNQNPVLVSRLKQMENNFHGIESRLQESHEKRRQLPNAGSSEPLRRAITAARKPGDVDLAIQSTQRDLIALQAQCTADMARLTLWNGVLEDVPGLPTPTRESINHFDEAYAEIDKRAHRLREKQEETADAWRDASRRLDEIQRAGAVPTEDELLELRTQRELAWRLLRRHWVDGEDVTIEARSMDVERSLPEAFEYRMIGADKLADRLRREADRVLTKASLLAEQETAKRRIEDLSQQRDECSAEKKQIDADWDALWASCEIQPHTPREMRAWLDNLETLRHHVGRFNSFQQQVNDLEHTRDTQIQLLKQQLQHRGVDASDLTSLDTALLEGEAVAGELEGIKRQQEVLEKEIETLERNLKSARTEYQVARSEFDAWQSQWKEVLEGLGLNSDTLPSEATDIIDTLRELFAKQSDADKLRLRLRAIDEESESFRTQVRNVAATIASDSAELGADDEVIRLTALLSEGRNRQSRRQQIEEQLQQARQDIQDSEAMILSMTQRLDTLCVEAKRVDHSELEDAERNSVEHFRLKAEVSSVEQEILDVGEGASLPELEAEAEGINQSALSGQIEVLINTINEELEPRRTVFAETKGRVKKELELMDGSDYAATLATQVQSVLARVRSNAERYVCIKLAARILRDEIERYRQENQGPLIKRASEHFTLLTQASFEGLRTDFTDRDEPVLVGLRANGERVHVAGMSSGTRDQLYLALRLAALEKYMESSEPMPFIVDDILVHFDDDRSKATLGVLAELAKKTQVILFTHHSQLLTQARELAVVHELS